MTARLMASMRATVRSKNGWAIEATCSIAALGQVPFQLDKNLEALELFVRRGQVDVTGDPLFVQRSADLEDNNAVVVASVHLGLKSALPDESFDASGQSVVGETGLGIGGVKRLAQLIGQVQSELFVAGQRRPDGSFSDEIRRRIEDVIVETSYPPLLTFNL